MKDGKNYPNNIIEDDFNLPVQEAGDVKPKYLAQKCPVCNGFGTLKYGGKVCQGCEGKGYVLVPTFDIHEGKTDGTKNKEHTIE